MSVLYQIKRALPSVIIGSVCFGAIYADWNYTQRWKKATEIHKQVTASTSAAQTHN